MAVIAERAFTSRSTLQRVEAGDSNVGIGIYAAVLLRLPPRSSPDVTSEAPAPDDWVTKGVRLPAGTELRATYKGQTYLARVASGALLFDGKRFDSPSAAAMRITQHPVNGWTFWECRLPGQGKWASMKELRRGR